MRLAKRFDEWFMRFTAKYGYIFYYGILVMAFIVSGLIMTGVIE